MGVLHPTPHFRLPTTGTYTERASERHRPGEGPRRLCAHPWRSDARSPSNCPLKCIYFKGDGAETEESGRKDGLVLSEGWIPWKEWLGRSEQPGSFSISFLVPTQRPHSPDISSYFPLINEPGRYWRKGEFTALNLQEAPNAGFRSNGTPSGQAHLSSEVFYGMA